jgi:C-terminal processing protease CtpA/Prc
MNQIKSIKYFLLFISCFAFGQNNGIKDELLDKTLHKDSLLIEFETFHNLINTIHPGQFMFCKKNDFEKCYDSLKSSIKTDLSILDYYKKTSVLMAKIKDGHTAIDRGIIRNLLNNRLVIPFTIFKIKDDYFINKSANKESQYLVGSKILKINGRKIQEIVSNLKQHIHLEGFNETGLNFRFKQFPFYYYLYDNETSFDIELIDETNSQKIIKVKGIEYIEFVKNTSTNLEPLTEEFRNKNIAILTVNSFESGYSETERIKSEKQIDLFFEKINKLKIKNLIIDLRDNGGGAPETANYLFSYLINKPYYYMDYVGSKFLTTEKFKKYASNPENIGDIDSLTTKLINGLHCFTETDGEDYWHFEKQQNKPNYYKGKLSVIINGGCFSTSGHFLAMLRNNKIGKFYGEYSQGSNYSNSGGQSFVLPYSKTLVWIPTFQYKVRTPNFTYDKKGIKPDIEVLNKPKDFKTNYDRQMNFVVKEILQKK